MKTKIFPKEETVEERLTRFAKEYEEILSRQTPEDKDWTYICIKEYIARVAPDRQDYTAEQCYSDIEYAQKDSDYAAKDAKPGEEYRAAWSKQFVESCDNYYDDYIKYVVKPKNKKKAYARRYLSN